MRRATRLLLALALGATGPAVAQVEARPITEKEAAELSGRPHDDAVQMPSPMVLEVKVSPRNFAGIDPGKRPVVWTTAETRSFVCDEARVRHLKVQRTVRRGRAHVEISPAVATEWFRQDIDLTVALLAPDGRELAKRTWDNLTIGDDSTSALAFGSRTKSPTLELDMAEEEFQALFADGQQPTVRIVVDIQDDEDEG
jgi:hypothetical protein